MTFNWPDITGDFPNLFFHTTFYLRSKDILQVPQIMFVSAYTVHDWIDKVGFGRTMLGTPTIQKLCDNRGQT